MTEFEENVTGAISKLFKEHPTVYHDVTLIDDPDCQTPGVRSLGLDPAFPDEFPKYLEPYYPCYEDSLPFSSPMFPNWSRYITASPIRLWQIPSTKYFLWLNRVATDRSDRGDTWKKIGIHYAII